MKKISLALFVVLCLAGSFANAQYSVLYTFNGVQGAYPLGSLTLSGHKFYGMANGGGANDSGCIFSIDTTGANFQDIYDFGGIHGGFPASGTLKIAGNKLYGMTSAGGANDSGCVFSIDTDGAAYKVLVNFTGPNGAEPQGSLTLANTKLFGMTYTGGTHKKGNIFTVDTTGRNYKDLENLTGAAANGLNPFGDVTVIKDKLFGMTQLGGTYEGGDIYYIDSNGTHFTNIYNFDGATGAYGAYPYNSLTYSGTQFFGMTAVGGANEYGNVFSIDTAGTYSKDLIDFAGTGATPSGAYPLGDVVLSGNKLYGMTYEGGSDDSGTIFSIDTNGNNYTELYDFATGDGGNTPFDDLTIVGNTLYGMTAFGGANSYGVIFRFKLPLPIGVTIVDTGVSCNGNSNGTATATVTGGIAAFTYLWSDANNQTTAEATGLSAGTYSVTVNDSYGDTNTGMTTITQPLVLVANASTTTNVSCNVSGSTSATASGGTSPYTYSWAGGSGNVGNTSTASGLSVGTYTVNVTDANGCTSSATTVVSQPANGLSAFASTTNNVTCYNGNDGAATANASGGTAPYTYLWSDAASQTTTEATGLTAGTYTVGVTDNTGCTSSASTVIGQPATLGNSAAVAANINCYGTATGSASANVSGGTSPYTYLWSDASSQNTATATGLSAGTYTVGITDPCGDLSSGTVVITQPNSLTASANTISNVSCNSGNNGSATASPSGGASPYTYLWNDASSQNTATATGLSAGNYTVGITDPCGDLASGTVVITQPTAIAITTGTTSDVTCNGGNNGSALTTVSGGVLPYTYSWTGSGGNNATASGLSAGTYTVSVMDANGCSSSTTATITQPMAISASTDFTYDNGSSNGTATVSTSGGTAPYTYMWNDANSQTTATATGLSAGSYCCTITDANGCGQTACVTVKSTLGIDNITNASNINIYPNPTIGNFTITGVTQGQVIELYDYLGQKISSTAVANNTSMHFDISTHVNGVYLIRIVNADGTLVTEKKMIKTE